MSLCQTCYYATRPDKHKRIWCAAIGDRLEHDSQPVSLCECPGYNESDSMPRSLTKCHER